MTHFIQKIVGKDEKIIGIARLHWIYIVHGALWFIGSMIASALFHAAVNYITTANKIPGGNSILLFLQIIDSYMTRIMLGIGTFIFALYAIKYVTTEIGLTNRRVIRKQGLWFVHTHEVDIEEIHGERIDLGYFGRLLDYGYINLDCRFVGDIRTPAIIKPERFIRALHKERSHITDSASMLAAKNVGPPDNATPQEPPQSTMPMAPPPPAPQPVPELKAEPAPVNAAPPGGPPPPAAPGITAPFAPAAAVSLPPVAASQPTVDAQTVARIVEEMVPKMVEKIAAEMTAQGANEAEAPPEDPLQNNFEKVAVKK